MIMGKVSALWAALFVFLVVVPSIVVQGYSGSDILSNNNNNRLLQREEPPSQPCSIVSLTDECPDESVVTTALRNACIDEEHGINAAKCYMQYLCDHHNQQSVNQHKECIDRECPLARHVPPLDCGQGGNVEEDEITQDEVPDDPQEEELIGDEITQDEVPDDLQVEELIEGEFTMNSTSGTTAAGEIEAPESSGGGGKKKKGAGGIVVGVLLVAIVGGLLFVFRGKLFGNKYGVQPDLSPAGGRHFT